MSEETLESDYPFKNRVWGAIETLKQDMALVHEKMRISDRDLMTRDQFYAHMQEKWEEVERQVLQTEKRLIHVDETLTRISERLDDIWKFPMKTLAFIAALASAATFLWKLFKELLPKVGNG